MFVIGKHAFSSHVCFKRVSTNDARRMKEKGVTVFYDERIVEYVVCFINSLTLGVWKPRPELYGEFEFDTKMKMDLFKPKDHFAFTGAWVAFMVADISYQLSRRGLDGRQFILHASPYDVPLTPWVILKLCENGYVLFSAEDGRVVGASHHEEVPDLIGKFLATSGGVFCAAHLEIFTTSEAAWSDQGFAVRGNSKRS